MGDISVFVSMLNANKQQLCSSVYAPDILPELETRELIDSSTAAIVKFIADDDPSEGMATLCDVLIDSGKVKAESQPEWAYSWYAKILLTLLRTNDGAYSSVVSSLHPDLTESDKSDEQSLIAYFRSFSVAQQQTFVACPSGNNAGGAKPNVDHSVSASPSQLPSGEHSSSASHAMKTVQEIEPVSLAAISLHSPSKQSGDADADATPTTGSLVDPNANLNAFLMEVDVDKTAVDNRSSKAVLELKNFQKELAEPALSGRNCMICAPTGSGKTCVAIHIADVHVRERMALTKRDPSVQKPKVAFLVPTQSLAEQQKRQFEKFTSLHVEALVGGEQNANRLSLCSSLDTADVFVMTAAILFNSIRVRNETQASSATFNLDNEVTKYDKLESIGVFSLIIFDECHRCDKEHMYYCIMRDHYLPHKLDSSGASTIRLPQIVGLTASPGTGQAKNMEEAFNHLVELCARLDVKYLQTVRLAENRKELDEFTKPPTVDTYQCKARYPDEFSDYVLSLMRDLTKVIENSLREHGDKILKDLSDSQPDFRKLSPPSVDAKSVGSPSWATYLGTFDALLGKFGPKLDAVRQTLLFCMRMLKVYYTAMRINRMARHADALKYLRLVLKNDMSAPELTLDSSEQLLVASVADANRASCPCTQLIERTFKSFYQFEAPLEEAAKHEIENLNAMVVEGTNRKLLKLKQLILVQIEAVKSSRVLVFVQERRDGLALEDFCKEDVELQKLNVGRLAGSNAARPDGGMTLNDQNSLLRKFEDGRHQVVISTSVAEEGIDIARCNLVIRYCYVTNEIAMVQSRGRARAKESKYVLIVDEDEFELALREQENQRRESLMRDALEMAENYSKQEFEKLVNDNQRMAYNESVKRQRERDAKLAATAGDVYNILCKYCSSLITTSVHVVKLMDTHHAVLDAGIYDRVFVQPCSPREFRDCSFKGKVFCANRLCSTSIGQICRFINIDFCVLAISGIRFERRVTEERSVVSKWSKAPFLVAACDASSPQISDFRSAIVGRQFPVRPDSANPLSN